MFELKYLDDYARNRRAVTSIAVCARQLDVRYITTNASIDAELNTSHAG